MDLAGVQSEFSLQVSLGLATALEQPQRFELEFAGVYFPGWHRW
jgi:hypothetical protein